MIEIRCERCKQLLYISEDMIGPAKTLKTDNWFCSENCRHIYLFEKFPDEYDNWHDPAEKGYWIAPISATQAPPLWWDVTKKPYVWGEWCPTDLTEKQRKKLAEHLSLNDVFMIEVDKEMLEEYIKDVKAA